MLDFTDVHCCDGGFAIKVPAALFAKTFDVKYTNGASYEICTMVMSPKIMFSICITASIAVKKSYIARIDFSRKYFHIVG